MIVSDFKQNTHHTCIIILNVQQLLLQERLPSLDFGIYSPTDIPVENKNGGSLRIQTSCAGGTPAAWS